MKEMRMNHDDFVEFLERNSALLYDPKRQEAYYPEIRNGCGSLYVVGEGKTYMASSALLKSYVYAVGGKAEDRDGVLGVRVKFYGADGECVRELVLMTPHFDPETLQ